MPPARCLMSQEGLDGCFGGSGRRQEAGAGRGDFLWWGRLAGLLRCAISPRGALQYPPCVLGGATALRWHAAPWDPDCAGPGPSSPPHSAPQTKQELISSQGRGAAGASLPHKVWAPARTGPQRRGRPGSALRAQHHARRPPRSAWRAAEAASKQLAPSARPSAAGGRTPAASSASQARTAPAGAATTQLGAMNGLQQPGATQEQRVRGGRGPGAVLGRMGRPWGRRG